MFKATPNPPETDPVSPYASLDSKELHAAAHRALDHYLVLPETKALLADRRPGCIFVIAPDVDSETLLAHACETLASANVIPGRVGSESRPGSPRPTGVTAPVAAVEPARLRSRTQSSPILRTRFT
ncbi:hypothetical protein QFZ84_001383 [Pseudomonas fluorescens]